jgi:hypothetical protein
MGQVNAWGVWFVDEPLPNRYMKFYETGYLRFSVKTPVDLEITIRSSNINPNTNRAKIRLSELGVPLDNQWHDVVVALSDLSSRQTGFDFSRMKTYFVIGTTAGILGHDASNIIFDVDHVRWLSVDPRVVDDEKVYLGLKEKIHPSGLVRSYGRADDAALHEAYTYDQALAAMAFTFRSGQALYAPDVQLAKNIFEVYKNSLFFPGSFGGFGNAYRVDTLATYGDNRSDRVAGPNAFLLLAMIHYRNVTGDTDYDDIIDRLADWLRSLQDTDGGIMFGVSATVPAGTKSTEHNMDVVSAFQAYARLNRAPEGVDYNVLAGNIVNWLNTEMYDAIEKRFYVGEKADGQPDRNRGLDVYAFPPLMMFSHEEIIETAEAEFVNTQTAVNTGVQVTGFDFGSLVCEEESKPVDKDAVWFEGTAQMALMYRFVGRNDDADFYLNELTKGAFVMSASGALGIPYASNSGTPYGYNCEPFIPDHLRMNSTNAAVSSMAWYLFARDKFNPFQPHAIFKAQARNIVDDAPLTEILWPAALEQSDQWVKAQSYVRLGFQGIIKRDYVVLIYTDNTNPSHATRFVDPTPLISDNLDSNPGGLLLVNTLASAGPDFPTSSLTLPLGWTVRDFKVPDEDLRAAEPNESATNPDAPLWFYIKDRNTPFIDPDPTTEGDEIQPFDYTNPEDYVRLGEGRFSASPAQPHLAHFVQGDGSNRGFYPSSGLDYVYFQVLPNSPVAQAKYRAPIYFDLLME